MTYNQAQLFDGNNFRTTDLVLWYRFGDTYNANNLNYAGADSTSVILPRFGSINLQADGVVGTAQFVTNLGEQQKTIAAYSYAPAITFPSASEITGV